MMDTIRFNAGIRMVAHRGLSGIEPENTASAFVAAGNRSYYGIETDVHRTADGHYILIHDDSTARVALDDLTVENSTYETLRALRLCDKDGQRGRADLCLPSLAEYSQICKKYGKVSVLELKNHFDPADLSAIISIVREEGWLDQTIFISFDLENLIELRRQLPDQSAQYLVGEFSDDLIDTLKRHRLDLDIYYKSLTADRAKQLHDAGILINVWTVDCVEDAQRMAEYGVDFITSNILE